MDSLSSAFERSEATARRAGEVQPGGPRHVPGLKRTDPGIAALAALPTLSIGSRVGPPAVAETAPHQTETSSATGQAVGRDTLRPGSVRSADLSKPSYAFEESWRFGSADPAAPAVGSGRASFETLIQGSPSLSVAVSRESLRASNRGPSLTEVGLGFPAVTPALGVAAFGVSQLQAAEPGLPREPAVHPLAVEEKAHSGGTEVDSGGIQLGEPAALPVVDEAAWDSAWQATQEESEPEAVLAPRRRILPWFLGVGAACVVGWLAFRIGVSSSEEGHVTAAGPMVSRSLQASAVPLDTAVALPPVGETAPEPASEDPVAAPSVPVSSAAATQRPSAPKYVQPVSLRSPAKTPAKGRQDGPTLLPASDPNKGGKRPPTARFPAPAAN